MKSIIRIIVVVALAGSIAMSVMSCGSQRMGCPGSITKSEKAEPARG